MKKFHVGLILLLFLAAAAIAPFTYKVVKEGKQQPGYKLDNIYHESHHGRTVQLPLKG